MSVTRVIFEKGIEVGASRNSVPLSAHCTTFAEVYAEIWDKYKVRPVVVTETDPDFIGGASRERHSVLTLDGQQYLGVLAGLLQLPQGMPEALYRSLSRASSNIQYVAGALIYHCEQLALLYVTIRDRAIQIRQALPIEGNMFSLQSQSEAYYELDALITAARRTYDALRYIIWPIFGRGGGQTPSNFSKTLTSCDKLPEPLRVFLTKSWALHGKQLTAYRDCIQHYAPITFGLETATLQKIDGGFWSVLLRIPDNPQTRSQRNYEFVGGLDALTYGWQVANELINVAAAVLAAIPGG